MYEEDHGAPFNLAAQANDTVPDEFDSHAHAAPRGGKPVPAAEPKHVTVTTAPGKLMVHVQSSTGGNFVDDLGHTFSQLLEKTPHGWEWSLDLGSVRTSDLRFMDILVALGRNLRRRGSALAIKGFHVPSVLAVFFELFQKRCQEQHIALEWVKEDASA